MTTTQAYFLYHFKDEDIVPFYVGESQHPESRLKQHQRDAADPTNPKAAYEYLRQAGNPPILMEVVPNTTEAALLLELTNEGHILYNANRGVSTAKKRTHARSLYSLLNAEAETRLQAKDAQEAARKILHSHKQNLSKPEIVRQRLTDAIPTLDELMEATWYECPVEQLGVNMAKTATAAQHCKFGIYDLYVGFRVKGKRPVRTEHTAIIRRKQSPTERRLGKWYDVPRERALEILLRRFDEPYTDWVDHG